MQFFATYKIITFFYIFTVPLDVACTVYLGLYLDSSSGFVATLTHFNSSFEMGWPQKFPLSHLLNYNQEVAVNGFSSSVAHFLEL